MARSCLVGLLKDFDIYFKSSKGYNSLKYLSKGVMEVNPLAWGYGVKQVLWNLGWRSEQRHGNQALNSSSSLGDR